LTSPTDTKETQVIALVDSLHSKGMIDRDIKLARVLVAQDGSTRFCHWKDHNSKLPQLPPQSTIELAFTLIEI